MTQRETVFVSTINLGNNLEKEVLTPEEPFILSEGPKYSGSVETGCHEQQHKSVLRRLFKRMFK